MLSHYERAVRFHPFRLDIPASRWGDFELTAIGVDAAVERAPLTSWVQIQHYTFWKLFSDERAMHQVHASRSSRREATCAADDAVLAVLTRADRYRAISQANLTRLKGSNS